MSRDITATAMRHAVRTSERGGLTLYSNGPNLVLVRGARELRGRISGEVTRRQVSSSGLARRVMGRYESTLRSFEHLDHIQALDAAILYAEAAWTHARRRSGR